MTIQNGRRDILANKLTVKSAYGKKCTFIETVAIKIVEEDYNLCSCMVLRKACYYYRLKLQHHWTGVKKR
jgi:hypothetical protein